jgi:hypothetical protein
MNHIEAAWPPLSPLSRRRARLRGRPSGLKGRYRDRCATGPRPALDPGVSTAPNQAAYGAAAGRCPPTARRRPPTTKIKSLQPSLYSFRGLPHGSNGRMPVLVIRMVDVVERTEVSMAGYLLDAERHHDQARPTVGEGAGSFPTVVGSGSLSCTS